MDSLIKLNNTLVEKKDSDVLLEAIKSNNTIEVVGTVKKKF